MLVPANLIRLPLAVFDAKFAAAVLLVLFVPQSGWPQQTSNQDPQKARAEKVFASEVLPIFQEKCFACHGNDPDKIRGQFNMHSRAGVLAGGESGELAVVPHRPQDSPIVWAVNWDGLEMPPKENDRLTAEQIQSIEIWIEGGAPWPDAARRSQLLDEQDDRWSTDGGVQVTTSGGLTAEWTDRRYDPKNLWAYQPLAKINDDRLSDATRNPVDVLIEDRLTQLELTPAPIADRRALIRRATFDLVGLPPTPEEVQAFVNDPAPTEAAFANVVERLLKSPHYGEQWGRHWLDVVRYADSSGYANDYERGTAWRYRDYVVRAFNDDKPYDEFIREQIAGDEIDAEDPELLIATGFLRMGPWELTGMEVPKVARQRFLDDVTDAVGQVFLAHMLQCARCHDHKFDPIPTRDYYSMQAMFATTQFAARPAAFLDRENVEGFAERKYLQQRLDYYQRLLDELNAKRSLQAARDWYRDNKLDSSAFELAVTDLQVQAPENPSAVSLDEVRKLLAKRRVDPANIPPRHVGFDPRDFGLERIARKGIERLRFQLERYRPIAFSVYSGGTPALTRVNAPLRLPRNDPAAGEVEQTCILVGGDPFSPAEPVVPAVLSPVSSIGDSSITSDLAEQVSGRRTTLANWIASADNPLTARVMVNRIWYWHFGQAIAGNPNNFGTTGKKPTHPKLLDYLARRFMDDNWSIKAMHRLIMNSKTYRRSSAHPHPAELAAKYPDATSYARFQVRRLEAEELRDAMLMASGELNRTVGGIPVRPEMNREAALQPRQVMGTFAEAWQPSPLPEQRHRRSIYMLRIRGLRDPFLEVFNAPASDISCEARDTSTVTPQVFSLFHSESSYDRALALANRLIQEQRSPAETVARLFAIVLSRPAKEHEVSRCLAHWDEMKKRHESLTFDPPVYPREVLREAVEENTGEKFTFAEPLEFYADFVPDLKPADADPRLRGLAELCLVLFNASEFVYVY